MVKVLLATPEGAGEEMPEGRPYNLVLGGGQAIPGVEELVMELTPGRDEGAHREVAGRLPRRSRSAASRRTCA